MSLCLVRACASSVHFHVCVRVCEEGRKRECASVCEFCECACVCLHMFMCVFRCVCVYCMSKCICLPLCTCVCICMHLLVNEFIPYKCVCVCVDTCEHVSHQLLWGVELAPPRGDVVPGKTSVCVSGATVLLDHHTSAKAKASAAANGLLFPPHLDPTTHRKPSPSHLPPFTAPSLSEAQ